MNIWIVRTSEPLPIDGKNTRLLRMGLLAEFLSNKNHQLTWFTSDHEHAKGELRFGEDKVIKPNENLELRLYTGINYTKRVSLKRLLYYSQISKKMAKDFEKLQHPDVVLISIPFIDIAYKAAMFCKKNNIPYILDMRDMWPEVLIIRIFKRFKTIGKLLTFPMNWKLKKISRDANAIWGISDGFLSWGLSKANRKQNQYDRVFYLSNKPNTKEITHLDKAFDYWESHGVSKDPNKLIMTYVGNMSTHQVALDKIIPWLTDLKIPYQLIIAGTGDTLDLYKKLAKGNPNIIFPGWIETDHINALFKIADIALFPYYTTVDFRMSVPNKVIEYLSYKMPIFSNIEGPISEMIVTENAGFYSELKKENYIKAVNEIWNKKSELPEISSNAFKLYERKFAYTATYGGMEKSLEQLAMKS